MKELTYLKRAKAAMIIYHNGFKVDLTDDEVKWMLLNQVKFDDKK